MLRWILSKRLWVVVTLLLFAAGGYWLAKGIPSELAPQEDQSAIIGYISSPTDSSFAYTNKYAKQVEAIYKQVPEREAFLMVVGSGSPSEAFSYLILKPWEQRIRSQQAITNWLTPRFAAIPGVSAFASDPSPFGRHGGDKHDISIQIMTAESYAELHAIMKDFVEALKQYPGLTNIGGDVAMDSQQFTIHINRNLAADLGVKLSDIAETIATMIGGSRAADFQYEGQNYDVTLQMRPSAREDLTAIDQLFVKSVKGKMIPLSSLVTVTSGVGPTTLSHYDRMRTAGIHASLAPGYNLGQAIGYIQELADQRLPDNTKYRFRGAASDYLQSQGRTTMAFGLALLFIYLVMAAQFESFIDPLIILLTVPLSIVGALLTLKLTGNSINIYSNIGMVTLIGLVTKHGILITDFANKLRSEGKTMVDAVVEAAALRLRPILMTTAAMVLGAVPLAWASGAGAESRHQIGWVIVGGMLIGTFFSLIVVPTAYTYLTKWRKPV